MGNDPRPLERIYRARARVERLEPQLVAARQELHAAVVEACDAGHSPQVVASVAGLSRERVRQIVARRRP